MPIGRVPIEKDSVISKMEGANTGAIKTKEAKHADKSKAFEISYSDPKYTFDDIILSEYVREEIEDAISIFYYRELIFDEWKLSRVIKNKCNAFINLYGASGTGKTMAANAIAHELKMKLLWVNYADIESKYVGETSKNIVYMFNEAEKNNAVILFDEADALLSKRVTDMSSATDVSVNQTRSVLLHLLDNYNGIVVFTTNFIQNYDPAFMRRIPYHIKFDLPNEVFRKKLLLHYLKDTIPNSIDFDDVAKKYVGITGSDIANAVMMSAVKIARKGSKELEQDVFEEALQNIIQSKKDNVGPSANFKVYEREVTEEYAMSQIKKGGTDK